MPSEKSGSTSIVWVVLAAVLGMFAVNLPRPGGDSSAPAPEKSAKQKASEEGEPAEDGDPMLPLRDFFAVKGDACDKAVLTQSLKGSEVKSLIVSVLDPIDSHLGYVFDQTVEVIDLAMSECGYVRDRFWFPWEEDKKKRDDQGRILGKIRLEAPGVLLFRKSRARRSVEKEKGDGDKDEPPISLCVVFLVGECPTTGIHKRAFASALGLIDQYQLRGPRDRYRIVGPACSGSEDSLQMVVRDWNLQRQVSKVFAAGATPLTLAAELSLIARGPESHLYVQSHFDRISGSATAIDRDDRDLLGFQATTRRAEDVSRAVRHFLEKRAASEHTDPLAPGNANRATTALLVESNTGYGAALKGKGKSDPDFLYLPFPVHFSRLKETVDNERKQNDARIGLPAPTTLVPQIREGKAQQRDVYPAQDSGTTAAVSGAALTNLLATIVREKIRYVGIVATDTRDQVFLTYALRESCPGVQIFVVGSDSLQTLPEYRLFMKGTIIGSTYPMFLPNQKWTGVLDRRIAFSGDGPQGNFNAIVALMRRGDLMIEYRPPCLDAADADLRFPPIWINAIDQNGNIVPMQYFADQKETAYLAKQADYSPQDATDAPPKDDDRQPKTIGLYISQTALAIVALGIGCIVLLYRVFWKGCHRLVGDSDDEKRELKREELGYRAACLLALAGLLLPIVFLLQIHRLAPLGGAWKWANPVWPLMILLPLLVASAWPHAWSACQRLGATLGPKSASARQSGYLGGAVLLAAGALLLWFVTAPGRLRSWDALLFERSMNLASGLSPLVPLFFLSMAIFAWGYCQLQRCHMSNSKEYLVESPFLGPKNNADGDTGNPHPAGTKPDHGELKELRGCDENVQAAAGDIATFIGANQLVHILTFVGIVALFWYLGVTILAPTLEGWCWDAAFFIGFLLGFLLFGLGIIRSVLCWRKLEKLMGAIALLPMVSAFDKLPGKIVNVFGGHLDAQRTRVSRRLLCVHQLDSLITTTEAYEKEIGARDVKLENVKILAANLIDHLKEETQRGEAMKESKHEVARLCTLLFELLDPIWKARPTKEAFGCEPIPADPARTPAHAGEAPNSRTAAAAQQWIAVAEEFLASWTVLYISQYFVQLRYSVRSVLFCSAMVLLAGSSYPFFPERLKLSLLLALVASGMALVFFVLVQINRNELLSRILGTAPNRITLDRGFFFSVLQFAGPLIAIVIASLGAFRFLLEPIVRMLM